MRSLAVAFTISAVLISILSSAASDYCTIEMVDYELTAVGYVADNEFTTSGSVCPGTCGGNLLHEINQACSARFTARCVPQCRSRDGRRRYTDCCVIAGKNHAGENNKYYFANVNGESKISLVSYVGSY